MEQEHSSRRTNVLLVLAPHPDDMELSSGLLCLKALACGWQVSELIMTDGSAGGVDPLRFGTLDLILARRFEALGSAQLMGSVNVQFFDAPDGALRAYHAEAVEYIRTILRRLHPDVICFPSIRDRHPDHQATHLSATEALKLEALPTTPFKLEYCFWGQDSRINMRLDYPAGRNAKLQALQAHRSQPIGAYLPRLRREQSPPDFLSAEFFYASRPQDTRMFLQCTGFNVSLLTGNGLLTSS